MHIIIEKARKAAGISCLKKNYPSDPKQRGCGYWAGFVAVISDQIGELDQEVKVLMKEKAKLASDMASLEKELNAVRKLKSAAVLDSIGHKEEWSVDKRDAYIQLVAS